MRYHIERFLDRHETVVKRLSQSTYVDDIVTGADSIEEAFEPYKQAKDIFRQGLEKVCLKQPLPPGENRCL